MSSVPATSQNPTLAALLSLILPGAGQFYLRARNAAIAIFAITVVMAFLIWFCLDNFHVGEIQLGTLTTSWLWLLLAAFWLWNVWDAYQRAGGKSSSRFLAFGIPLLVIYVIAIQVTDVNLPRLVTRFNDVKIIFDALVHPDFLTRDTTTQAGATTIWIPCSNPPQTAPGGANSGLAVGVDKLCGTVGDTLAIAGQGFNPNTTGNIYWQEYGGTNEVQVRANDAPVVVTTDAEGKFSATFPIPSFAGRDGLDPNAPVVNGIEARFTQDVGPLKPSENFGILIGKIDDVPAPGWLVSLGIVPAGGTIRWFVAGGIFVTIALGVLATLISVAVAAPLSFFGARNIMARLPGGTIIYYIARSIFNVARSIDTLIWAIVLVTWTGLGALTGLMALTIHSIAAVAKLYSEDVEHIDPGPVEAISASGGTFLQNIRFAVIPQIIPSFLAYSLLRWDINMRSSTIVGLVSGAGIGFYVFESIRKGGYREYAAALWLVAVVVLIVDYLSAYWREKILQGDTVVNPRAIRAGRDAMMVTNVTSGTHQEPSAPARTIEETPRFYKTRSGIFYSVLLLVVLVISWNLANINLAKFLEPAPTFAKLLLDFISLDTSADVWSLVIRNLLVTIFQALLATTVGAVVAMPVAFLAAKNITGRNPATAWIYYITRFVLSFLRSIEALLYASIFVFWVGAGSFAGMLGLTIATFALIGKLFSEAIENIDEGTVEAMTATGANRFQSIMFAVVPQVVPPFISYAIYQWDINIRLATLVGLVGGGGIGQLFLNYVGQLQYHKAGVVILFIVVVVTLMDFASAKIRQRLV